MTVLQKLIIPRIDLSIRYILSELEEMEREDIFRLKRIKEKKMKKVIEDGAGEQVAVTDVIEPKKEETPESEPTKPVEEVTTTPEDKQSPTDQPKELAEMGVLTIIKAPENRMELGDAFISTPQLKTMSTIRELEEIEGISSFDKKEKYKKPIEELEPDDKNVQKVKDGNEGDLETGQWFKIPSKSEDKANINGQVSEYSKIDDYKEIEDNDTSAVKMPLIAKESIMDLDKRALTSLYKDLDSNYYKPTIEDLFSHHDIAMRDSLSLQDISTLDHSLVDLESIDFSIDSKGKVIPSKNNTSPSSPSLSTYREKDFLKSMAKYDEDGLLVAPTDRLASVRWLGDGITEENVMNTPFKHEVNKESRDKNLDSDKSAKKATDEIAKHTATEANIAQVNIENEINNKITDKDHEPMSTEDSKPDDDAKIFQSIISSNNDLEVQESAKIVKEMEQGKQETLEKASNQSNIKISEVEDEDFKKVRSARSSRDLHKSKDQSEPSQKHIAEVNKSHEMSLEETSNSNETHKSKVEKSTEKVKFERKSSYNQANGINGFSEKKIQEEDIQNINKTEETNKTVFENTVDFNQTDNKDRDELNRTEKETVLKSIENIQGSRKTTEHFEENKSPMNNYDNLRTGENDNKNSDFTEPTRESSPHNRQSETKGINKHEQLQDYEKLLRIKDSNEIINTKEEEINSKKEQLKRDSQIKTDTTNSETKRDSQDQNETENNKTNEASVNENKNKPLKIQNSDEKVRTNQEDKRTSKDRQSKETKNDKDENKNEIEDQLENSDNERSSSLNRQVKHSGDDHVKQE